MHEEEEEEHNKKKFKPSWRRRRWTEKPSWTQKNSKKKKSKTENGFQKVKKKKPRRRTNLEAKRCCAGSVKLPFCGGRRMKITFLREEEDRFMKEKKQQ